MTLKGEKSRRRRESEDDGGDGGGDLTCASVSLKLTPSPLRVEAGGPHERDYACALPAWHGATPCFLDIYRIPVFNKQV